MKGGEKMRGRTEIWKGLISLLVFTFLFFNNWGNVLNSWAKNSTSEKKILMIIAPQNFRDEELFIPKKIFEDNGYDVEVACSSLKTAKGMLGARYKPELLLSKVRVEKYQAIILVGGSGSVVYFNNKIVHRIVRNAVKEHKVVGAICLAPCILAKAGVLKGKKATVWYSAKNCLIENGAIYTGRGVEKDGNIITASGPLAAKQFAYTILKSLK
jgi:protease I